jgi:TonB family protein
MASEEVIMKYIVFILAAVMLSGTTVLAVTSTEDFGFNVYVLDGLDDDLEIYGRFSAAEGEYGGMELVFFGEKYSYSIRALEKIDDMTETMDAESLTFGSTPVLMVIHLFVKPILDKDNKIRLTGIMKKMYNTRKTGEPLFQYDEEKLDFTLFSGEAKLFSVKPLIADKTINFKLEAEARKSVELYGDNEGLSFDMVYSLYDVDHSRFAIEKDICRLNLDKSGNEGRTVCNAKKLFYLNNGDSLLYLTVYSIKNYRRSEDGAMNVNFHIKRHFYLNPSSFYREYEGEEELSGDNYGTGQRTIDRSVKIDGEKCRVKAEISDGVVSGFQWNNIKLTKLDIVLNWTDIVAILKQIESTGDYSYKKPVIDYPITEHKSDLDEGMLSSPANYTGQKIRTAAYSKSLTVMAGEKAEIEIPFTDNSLLPFNAKEIIVFDNPEKFIDYDNPPEMIYYVQPEYPIKAKNERKEAEVLIKAFVNKDGDVVTAKSLRCDKTGYGFEDVAVAAALKCKYKPAEIGGRPIGVWVNYKVEFKLEK